MEDLYCGACGDSFKRETELRNHLELCKAARALLPMIWLSWAGKDQFHQIAAFVVSIKKSIAIIRKYAWAISVDMDTIKRAEIHSKLCNSLGISRKDFRPFESQEIKEIPDQDQAENIIWNELTIIPFKLGWIKK